VPDEEDAMQGIIGASIAYRLAFGPNAGRKALTLQAVPASDTRQQSSELVSKQSDGGPVVFHCTQASPVNHTSARNSSALVVISRDPRLRSSVCH